MKFLKIVEYIHLFIIIQYNSFKKLLYVFNHIFKYFQDLIYLIKIKKKKYLGAPKNYTITLQNAKSTIKNKQPPKTLKTLKTLKIFDVSVAHCTMCLLIKSIIAYILVRLS